MEKNMEILYKYVPAERALTCLPEVGDGTLRATQPSALNDPFECSAMKTFVENERDLKKLAEVLSSLNKTTPISEDEVKSAKKRWGSLYWGELLRQQISQRFGVVSLTSEALHPLLWTHYTIDGSGFVIGYAASALRNLTQGEEQLAQVNYQRQPPVVTMGYEVLGIEENIYRLLLMKGDQWEYEKEWRIIIQLKHTIGTGTKDDKGQPINLIRIPNEAVKKVYYTERTSSCTVEQINSRLQNPNNRFGVTNATKLVLAEKNYSYEEEQEICLRETENTEI